MGTTLKTVANLLVGVLLFALIYDVKKAQGYKQITKNALDIATKSAALQIDMTPSKIAIGRFEIDPIKADQVFRAYVSDNLGASALTYVADITVVNASATQTYTAPNGKAYTIDCPTIFASITYTYNGLFMNRTITIDTLSGSQVKNKNDIK